MVRLHRVIAATVAYLLFAPAWGGLQAQDTRRAYATRAELQETLVEIDQVLQSAGYSARLKDAKRREAQLIRQRLSEGDLQVGDQVVILVEGVQQFSDTFNVSPGRVVILPGGVSIPVQGVLRAEAEEYFRDQIARVVREPTVRVQPRIRLSVLGQVNRPGFYHLPADMLASDALMAAGGLQGETDPSKTRVRRGGVEIVSQEEFQAVLVEGATLDQLNLRAGDELIVENIKRRGISTSALYTIGGLLTTVTYLVIQIF